MHTAIAGNIGSGKTTLTTKLAKHYKWEAHYEDVENNPYLNDFFSESDIFKIQIMCQQTTEERKELLMKYTITRGGRNVYKMLSYSLYHRFVQFCCITL